MNKNDILTLNIDGNTFSAMKDDFNAVLRETLKNMQEKRSDTATLTLKLTISMTEMQVPDFLAPSDKAMRTAHKPCFNHKISSLMKIQTEESGSLKGEYELVWDEDENNFVMCPIENGQQSMFDDENGMYVDYVVADDENDSRQSVPALPSGSKMLEAHEEPSDGYDYDEPREV